MSDALKKQKSLTTHRRDTTPWPTLARFTPLQTVMGLEERSGFHQYIILYSLALAILLAMYILKKKIVIGITGSYLD